jgi:PBSX family phage terminase large subunit
MAIEKLSERQLQTLTWWCDGSSDRDKEAVICDGAVRSGKTLCMGLSFFCWAMRRFDGRQFGICGKTIVSLRRNFISPLLPTLRALGFSCAEKVGQNVICISCGGRENRFYLFGGKDEGSAALIQGATLAGVLFDEAALMPRSFVEQACARCSVEDSKFWFNCNPENPQHWFYTEWICRAEERKALYLHFSMEDNPSLSRQMLERYKGMYSGVFYRRFVLGEWVTAQGRVYDFFDEGMVCNVPEGEFERFAVSCDYGTANPASFGLWGRQGGVWYRIEEYYYDSRRVGRQKTDAEYVAEMKRLIGDRRVDAIVVDPSAASFIEALTREGYPVRKADNDVLSGIRLTADMLRRGEIRICGSCRDAIREFGLYCWDERATERDAPIKQNDHAMDDIRYFVTTVAAPRQDSFAAIYVERQGNF